MHYLILIHKDSKSDYGVIVPDLRGCFSAGSTYEEALSNAKEAIECHLEGLLLDGDSIPAVSDPDEHIKNTEHADGIWAFIEVDLSQISGKAKRINITLPELVLSLIDLYTKSHSLNRSAFIAEASLSYMSHEGRQRAHQRVNQRSHE